MSLPVFGAATKYLFQQPQECQVVQLERCQSKAEGHREVSTGPHGTEREYVS